MLGGIRCCASSLELVEQALLEAPGLQTSRMTLASGAGHVERDLSPRWERTALRVGDAWFVPPVPVSLRWR